MTWQHLPVRRLFHVVNGGTPSSDPVNWDGGILWATPVDLARVDGSVLLGTERTLSAAGLRSGSRAVPSDSLVLSTRAPIGYIAETPTSMAFNQGCRGLVPRTPMALRFFRYQFSALANQLAASGQGSTFLELSGDALAAVRLAVPPVASQRAIADYLDRETARIDALIAAKRRMVELLQERFRVARIDLVIDRARQQRRAGPAWIGSIPAAWKLMRLKFVAEMQSGHTPNMQIEAYWIDCTVPWVTLNDVSNLETNWRFFNPKNAVNELGLQNSSAHVLPENSVALSRDATVGRSALLGRPMAVSQHFVAWVCGPGLMPEYLLNVLRGPMQHHFGSLTAGATIATIGMPDLNQLVVPIPPIEEQARISQQIAEVESRAGKMLVSVSSQITLLQERRQALITAAVTGELDIPEAA